jgi:hypothetical protein
VATSWDQRMPKQRFTDNVCLLGEENYKIIQVLGNQTQCQAWPEGGVTPDLSRMQGILLLVLIFCVP